jgi:hypothetical protein
MTAIERRPKSIGFQDDQPLASIVGRAAAILAEEAQSLTAAGMSQVPTLLGTSAPNGRAEVDELRNQPRSLVDTVVQLIGQRPEQLAGLVNQTGAYSGAEGGGGKTATLLLLAASRPVKAGDVACVKLRLENDDTETDECVLYATDLIGAAGHRIPASHLGVFPDRARIPGGGLADVQIEIRVPSGTPGGCYTGLLQVDDGEYLRALVQLTVSQ